MALLSVVSCVVGDDDVVHGSLLYVVSCVVDVDDVVSRSRRGIHSLSRLPRRKNHKLCQHKIRRETVQTAGRVAGQEHTLLSVQPPLGACQCLLRRQRSNDNSDGNDDASLRHSG